MSNLLTASRALLDDLTRRESLTDTDPSVALLRTVVEEEEKIDGRRDLLDRVGNPSLTPRQLDTLICIDRYWRSNCCSPTLQAIADRLQVNKETIFEHVSELERKGVVKRIRGQHRSIQIIDARTRQPLTYHFDQATELRRLVEESQ